MSWVLREWQEERMAGNTEVSVPNGREMGSKFPLPRLQAAQEMCEGGICAKRFKLQSFKTQEPESTRAILT